VIDLAGVFTSASPGCGKVLGWDPAQLLGASIDDFSPLDHPASAALIAGASGLDAVIEHQFRQDDDSYRWVETTIDRVPNSLSGDLTEIRGSTRDIGRHKVNEGHMTQAGERLSLAFNNAPIGTALMDVEGRFTQVNEAFCLLVGRSPTELGSTTSEAITNDDDFANDRLYMQQLIDGEVGSYVGRKRYLHADGHEVWASLNVSLLQGADGRRSEFIVQVHDITHRKAAEISLAEDSQRFPLAFNNAPIGMALMDVNGRFTQVNEALCRFTGRSAEDMVNLTAKQISDAYGITGDRRDIQRLIDGEISSYAGEKCYRHVDGHQIWASVGVSLLRAADGRMREFIIQVADITARKLSEAALAEASQRFSLAFRDAPVGMALMDVDGRFTQVNEAFCLLSGRSAEELVASTSEAITHVDDIAGDRLYMQQLIDGQITSYVGEKRYRHPDGHEIWTSLSVSLLRGVDGGLREFIVQVADITDRKVAENELTHLALHDGLTGLPNRELFLDRTRHALEMAKRLAGRPSILFLDLDHFKVINDSMGHAAGDNLLMRVAERLSEVVRPGDTLARLGGDEFTVLCEGIGDEGDVRGIAGRIGAALDRPIRIGDRDVVVTASIGIATADPLRNVTAEALLQEADAALYRAKDRGRARFELYSVDLRAHVVQRLEIEQSLRGAAKRGEFRVWYQPQFALPSRQLSGVEALVRWAHPVRGLLEPKDFIDVAEETGLIVELGDFVLEEVCRQSQEWAERLGEPGRLPISVNVSPRQLASGDFPNIVRGLLGRFGLPPSRLHLEITEAGLMKVHGSASRELAELRNLGVRIGIDDFGTGYSSLAHLAAISVDFLKIDTSFVAGLGTHDEDEAIVCSVIALAHSLRLAVIAEGAETTGQLVRLTDLGSDSVQGFLLGRPQAAAEFEALLAV
jgi:diguanylate cyclase (GGDEF)-like protein/PAS domain S-box-containing protein